MKLIKKRSYERDTKKRIEEAAHDKYTDNTFAYKSFIDGAEYAISHQWISVEEALPRNLYAVKRAIQDGMNNNPQWKISRLTNGDADLAIKWWMSNQTLEQYFFKDKSVNQLELF